MLCSLDLVTKHLSLYRPTIFMWQNNAYFVLFPVIIFDFIISGDPDAESASAILQ